MKIKHNCLLKKKKEKEYQTVCLFKRKKEKKLTVKITKGFPSLSLTKRNVKSVIQSPEKSLFLP